MTARPYCMVFNRGGRTCRHLQTMPAAGKGCSRLPRRYFLITAQTQSLRIPDEFYDIGIHQALRVR
ncbi:hypothetical protein GCM10010924_49490 [Rhizobium wenxiniae]|nr:hypothetical protein GCM10010924_49490 [Rhizobium wenxiniae]